MAYYVDSFVFYVDLHGLKDIEKCILQHAMRHMEEKFNGLPCSDVYYWVAGIWPGWYKWFFSVQCSLIFFLEPDLKEIKKEEKKKKTKNKEENSDCSLQHT